MKHIDPREFLTRGQQNALALAHVIENASHFNMFYWCAPGHVMCASCMAAHACAMQGGNNLMQMSGEEIRNRAADFLGFDEEQAYLAFTPGWVRDAGCAPDHTHRPDHVKRAVALLRQYAETGIVSWTDNRVRMVSYTPLLCHL